MVSPVRMPACDERAADDERSAGTLGRRKRCREQWPGQDSSQRIE
jgi:hypothetical protein